MGLLNKIEVEPMKSEYCKVEHHTIVIDGTPLDILLHKYYPSNNLLGMIPTIIDWVCDSKEKECIKGRFNSASKEVVLPVLMCPDDCDLSCTVIVANVVITDRYIETIPQYTIKKRQPLLSAAFSPLTGRLR